MRRARFAFVVIACAGGLGLVSAACGPDLPERMWRSENVRYFSRAGDDTVCPAILDELEEHGAVIAGVFGIERTIVSYYKFDGVDDYAQNAECDGAGACAPNATVRSPESFDRHELIHAYLAPYGHPPPLLTEGTAVALSCGRYERPTGSWRDAYDAERLSLSPYASGGWLVGYLLRMFRATWLLNLYGSVAVNATANEFAQVFADIYNMSLDEVWAAAISTPQAPLRCPWECGARPALPTDGAPHPLTPVCGAGGALLSVDLPAAAVTRWRIDGDGWFFLRSCDGNDEPAISISGRNGAGGLWAPLGAGKYFVDAFVEPGGTPTLAADTGALGALWSIDCASAPAIPDDLGPFGALSLFYPSSLGPRFTSLGDGNDRPGTLVVLSDDPTAAASLCTSCDTQTCRPANASVQLTTSTTPPGTVVSVPPGPASTIWLQWF